MKKQRYIVEIEMPDGDFISAGWLKDLIQTDCDVEDESRKKVIVQETSLPFNLDEAAREYSERFQDEKDKLYAFHGFRDGASWRDSQIQRLSNGIDGAAELSANDAMIKRQFPSVVYNTGLKCFDHSDLIKQFKAGAEWMAEQGCIDSYQKQARTFLLEKFQNMPMFELVKYCTLGLNEEAGEVAGKVKKSIRDADGKIDEGRIDAIVKEMGDVLWYLAIMAYALGLPLSHIAQKKH